MDAKVSAKSTSAADGEDIVSNLPVREGEAPWTPTELAGVREELEDELAARAEEIAEMEVELADLLSEGIDMAGDDQADSGSKTIERDNEMALLGATREMHKQITKALARIDDGTYGYCESCGKSIGKLRLQAIPRALLCLSCKQRQDRH